MIPTSRRKPQPTCTLLKLLQELPADQRVSCRFLPTFFCIRSFDYAFIGAPSAPAQYNAGIVAPGSERIVGNPDITSEIRVLGWA
jgi:hypothetical protein